MNAAALVKPHQQSFYDQAEKAKHEGIELVFRNADTKWKREASKKLFQIAQARRTFTSDDILEPLGIAGIVTKDNRALGAILLAASRMHLIKSTDTFIRSRRRSRHGAPIMVWKSLIFKSVK